MTIRGFSEPDFFLNHISTNPRDYACVSVVRVCVHVCAYAGVCLKRARLLLQRRGLLPPHSLHNSSQKPNDTRDFLAGISQMECDRNTE